MVQTKSKDFTHEPPLHDDSWWAAVMADEKKMESPRNVSGGMIINSEVRDRDYERSVDWELVARILENEKLVECQVVGYNRGGLIVIGDGFHGFVPISHLIDIPFNPRNQDRESTLMSYDDRSIVLKVIECDSERGRVVLSERAAQVAPGARKQILSTLEDGAILRGEVTNVTNFGAFVDLGGIEGLIHISELSWGRVGHPGDIINTGKQVEVLVLQVDHNRERVALSIKRTRPNPWPSVCEHYKLGDIVDVEITEIVRFGAFARLEEDLEGLIHISEMGQQGNFTPGEVVQKGQKVWARILLLDAEKQRISLRLESKD
ncbi:MAG: 30S ribosomal protein S1 [Chloroflexi bacterium]|nr:30S ribosomal protein S1 [Chloroflexota bacterium]